MLLSTSSRASVAEPDYTRERIRSRQSYTCNPENRIPSIWQSELVVLVIIIPILSRSLQQK